MGTKKDALQFLNQNWHQASKELVHANWQISEAERTKKAVLEHMRGLLSAFKAVGGKPETAVPTELRFELSGSIGDMIESVLTDWGKPAPRKDLMNILKGSGKLSGKNARVIFANAIKRDTKKRFRLENGMVFLITQSKQNG